jgi:hypothetical protein
MWFYPDPGRARIRHMPDLTRARGGRQAPGLLVVFFCGFGVATTGAAQDPYRREPPVDRTTPILERMTPEQREHAKLHASHEGVGTRLLDHKVLLSTTSDPGPIVATPFSEVLKSLTCEADAVFTGFVQKGESFPTETGQMLFTDYQVTVGDVFRTRRGAQMAAASTAVVTQVGGGVKVDGTMISATLASYPPLTPGQEYVFFAQFLPRTKSYHPAEGGRAWPVRRGRVKPFWLFGAAEDDLSVLASHLTAVRCEK